MVGDDGYLAVQFLREPPDGQGGVLRSLQGAVHAPALDQTVGVPYFVAEVAALFHLGLVEEDVVAGGGA